jgi:hypothetical protein
MNHSKSFYVEMFYSNMFRLMYKQPSSGWKGTKEKLPCGTPISFYTVYVCGGISTYNIVQNFNIISSAYEKNSIKNNR